MGKRNMSTSLQLGREGRLSPCGRGWAYAGIPFRSYAKVVLPFQGTCADCCDSCWGQTVPPTCFFPSHNSPSFFPSQCEFEQILDLEIRLRTAMMCLFRKGEITGKWPSKRDFQPRPQFFPDAYIAWQRPVGGLLIFIRGL